MLTVLFCHVSTVVPTGNMDLQSKQFRKNLSKENEKKMFFPRGVVLSAATAMTLVIC